MARDYAAQVERLRGKLCQLLEICQRAAAFGESHHIFTPQAPLSEQDVQLFEAQHGVRLPQDYREFVLGVANGCPGPGYGILRLEQWAEAVTCPTCQLPQDYLARPCPLRPDLPRDSWREALGCPAHEQYQGAITVSRRDDTRYCLLIVSGACRGRVVQVDLGGACPRFAPQLKFLDWYEDWLDETLESAQYEL